MTRYIYRIIAIIIHTRRLLRIAVSPAYNKFFDKEFNIHPCPKMLQKIYVDPQKLLESTKLPVLSAVRPPNTITTASLHAELNIFATLIKMTLEKKPEAYWVIGASKLLCAGCHTIIAKAYPEVLQANPQTGLVRSFSFFCAYTVADLKVLETNCSTWLSWQAVPQMGCARPVICKDFGIGI